MSNFGVIIDRAHGINVAGKRSPDAAKNLKDSPYYFIEYEWSSEMCKVLAAKLKTLGIRTEFTVSPDDPLEPGLSERANIANNIIKGNPDTHWVFISLHADYYGDPLVWNNVTGYSIYTTKGTTNSDKLAECILKHARVDLPHFGKAVRTYKNGHIEQNFTVIFKSICPAVLAENMFYSNKKDIEFLKSEEGKKCIADFHSYGIVDYFNQMYDAGIKY